MSRIKAAPIRLVCAAIFILLVMAAPQNLSYAQNIKPGDYFGSLVHDGWTRTYIVHIPPAYDGKKLLPLVILLHGGATNTNIAVRILSLL